MRTAINVVIILSVGLAIGLGMRLFQQPSSLPATTKPAVAKAPVPAEPIVAESAAQVSTVTKPPGGAEWLTNFSLTERSGEQVSSDDLKGQPYVVSFFFSTCPSICVMQNQKIQQLQTEFEDQGVRFVAISVDPETDTPEQLREYAKRYKADEDQWLFMTGDLTYIRRVGAEVFKVAVDEKFHTEKLILVDPAGEISGYYTWTDDRQFEQLKTDIEKMIASGKGAT